MGEPKPFASLTSGLLARKGDARPAMRRQYIGGSGNLAVHQEDLGWNDMGEDMAHHVASQPHAGLSPMPTPHAPAPMAVITDAEPVSPIDVPPVVEQQKMLAEKVTNGKVEKEAPSARAAKAPPKTSAIRQRKEKAAFTLRLDPDRHLKLRLACAVANRSAQQLVVEALDSLLDQLPQIEQLADQLPLSRAAGQA